MHILWLLHSSNRTLWSYSRLNARIIWQWKCQRFPGITRFEPFVTVITFPAVSRQQAADSARIISENLIWSELNWALLSVRSMVVLNFSTSLSIIWGGTQYFDVDPYWLLIKHPSFCRDISLEIRSFPGKKNDTKFGSTVNLSCNFRTGVESEIRWFRDVGSELDLWLSIWRLICILLAM